MEQHHSVPRDEVRVHAALGEEESIAGVSRESTLDVGVKDERLPEPVEVAGRKGPLTVGGDLVLAVHPSPGQLVELVDARSRPASRRGGWRPVRVAAWDDRGEAREDRGQAQLCFGAEGAHREIRREREGSRERAGATGSSETVEGVLTEVGDARALDVRVDVRILVRARELQGLRGVPQAADVLDVCEDGTSDVLAARGAGGTQAHVHDDRDLLPPAPDLGAGESSARSMSIAVRVARRTQPRPAITNGRNLRRSRTKLRGAVHLGGQKKCSLVAGRVLRGARHHRAMRRLPRSRRPHGCVVTPRRVSMPRPRPFPHVAARRLSPEPGTLPSTSAWCPLAVSRLDAFSGRHLTKPALATCPSKQIRRRRANPTRQHPHTRATLTASRARGFGRAARETPTARKGPRDIHPFPATRTRPTRPTHRSIRPERSKPSFPERSPGRPHPDPRPRPRRRNRMDGVAVPRVFAGRPRPRR